MTSPVHVGRALESLRNSDFNTVSAIGEVIDNSIEAEAKNIRLRIKKVHVRKNVEDLTEIAFGDDGVGMDKDTLSKCLQLGFSVRYNSRKGIGRFGVGMTLGAITQCTRIEVYSKPAGGGWNFTHLDLTEIKDKEDPPIPAPEPAEIPREYADLVGETGTLVIWKDWDREDAKIEEMIRWIGRTYRKFIGEEIIRGEKVVPNDNQRHIFLDDGDTSKEISAYDPLYVTKTAYNSETADLEQPIRLEEVIHQFDKPPEKPSGHGEIIIRSSLLPAEWRKKRGTGNSTENNERLVYRNEGVSILRNGREVFYGHIPYYKITDDTSQHYKGFIDLDRFWGCEIEFDAVLDHWFSVKNIKVGARPVPDLRDKIQEKFNDTIMEFRKEIRNTWKAASDKERKDTSGEITESDEKAEGILRSSNPPEPVKKEDINELIKVSGQVKDDTKRRLEEKLEESPIVFKETYDMDERGNFIDIVRRGGRTILILNMKHPFFRKFDEMMEQIKTRPASVTNKHIDDIVSDMNVNMKLLLASFTLAQNELNRESTQLTGTVIDKLIRNWTFQLEQNVRKTLEKKPE